MAPERLTVKQSGSQCCSRVFWETNYSEGQCRYWSAVYYTGEPKVESPLSQGPQPVFVKP